MLTWIRQRREDRLAGKRLREALARGPQFAPGGPFVARSPGVTIEFQVDTTEFQTEMVKLAEQLRTEFARRVGVT